MFFRGKGAKHSIILKMILFDGLSFYDPGASLSKENYLQVSRFENLASVSDSAVPNEFGCSSSSELKKNCLKTNKETNISLH